MSDPTPPEGYKLAWHSPCKRPAFFVKEHVMPCTVARAADVLYFDGHQPLTGMQIPRCGCKIEPTQGRYTLDDPDAPT